MNFLFAFIPRRISNKTVIAFYELLRKIQKFKKASWREHLFINQKAFSGHLNAISKNKGYIEDQNSYTDMPYGKATMQYSGCEIFAVYNAAYSLLAHPLMDLPELISCFEKDGMALGGKFGTPGFSGVKGIYHFFQHNGKRLRYAGSRISKSYIHYV